MITAPKPFPNPVSAAENSSSTPGVMGWEESKIRRICQTGIIATLSIDDPEDAVPLAETLVESGLDVMELALRTPAAIAALRAIRRNVPDMLAGVGTVLRPEQVNEAAEAGAEFGMAPGTNQRVIQAALRRGIPFAPGVATPSDIEQAVECGCRILKFFPAESLGGLRYLESMAAPFLHLGCRFLPLGGIQGSDLAGYLSHPLILAVGGSWIAPASLIQEKRWERIGEQARTARDRVLAIRAK